MSSSPIKNFLFNMAMRFKKAELDRYVGLSSSLFTLNCLHMIHEFHFFVEILYGGTASGII